MKPHIFCGTGDEIMRITVERTMGESYLLAEGENGETEQDGLFLETQMLTENRIEGLLPMQVCTVNRVTRYQYPVSGKAAIKQLYEKAEMNADAIRQLIEGIRKAFLSAEEYLLQAEHILLDPAYIFCDRTDGSVCLCACPVWEGSLQKGMQDLADYLISVTDHSRDDAIDLSYGFYRKVASGDYRFDDLLAKEETKVQEESVREQDGSFVKCEPSAENGRKSGALSVLGFAAVFAFVICFTICLLLLKFR